MLEHRFAQLTALATFALLIIGGTVNPTGSSLACPEPTLVCNGELFPAMTGGVLYEHGHRLAAMTVGLLQICLSILLWRRRKDLKWFGLGALALVVFQGALGAITVAYKLPWFVSSAHLATAMGYIALLFYIAFKTAPAGKPVAGEVRQAIQGLRPWIAAATGAVFIQIVLGGLMRHHGGALACLDLPLCQGSLWPAAAYLPLKLHMAHRIFGVITGIIAIAVAYRVFRGGAGWQRIRLLACAVPLLVIWQVIWGALVITSFRDVPVVVAHFGGAAALWAVWLSLSLMARSSTQEVSTGSSVPTRAAVLGAR